VRESVVKQLNAEWSDSKVNKFRHIGVILALNFSTCFLKSNLKELFEIMWTKETGHLWLYYIYMTVFIINAANLAHILL
jgi:hypothetical protein